MDCQPSQDLLPPVPPDIFELMDELLSKVDQTESQPGPSNANPSRNFFAVNSLNPFLIDNVLHVLLPNLTKKKLFDIRQVCRLWNQKGIQEVNCRRDLSCNFRTSAEIEKFYQLIDPYQAFHLRFNKLIVHRSQDLDTLVDHPEFGLIFNNVKEFSFHVSNDLLNINNLYHILRTISGTVHYLKVEYNDITAFNYCLKNYDTREWPHNIVFRELRKLYLDIYPMINPSRAVPNEVDETTRYLKMFTQNAPNLKNLKMRSINCKLIDICLLNPDFSVMFRRLESLELVVRSEITMVMSRIRLKTLVQQHNVHLKNFGLSCFFNFHHNVSNVNHENRLEIEFRRICRFLSNQSTTLESLKLSIWQAGPYFLTKLRIPSMSLLKKLIVTSKVAGAFWAIFSLYEDEEEQPQCSLARVDLHVNFPLLTHFKFVGRGFLLRNFILTGQLSSESLIDLEIKSLNYGTGEEVDPINLNKWFPNLQRLYINKCNFFIRVIGDGYIWPASLSEIEMKITSEDFSSFNFNHFVNATGLRILKISEWRETNAERVVSKLNLDSMSNIIERLEKFVLRGFKVEKSLFLYIVEMFGIKLDLDFTTKCDLYYL